MVTAIPLLSYLESVRRKKLELGINDSEEMTEAMRNKGENRTPEKVALLKAVSDRTKDSVNPVLSYFPSESDWRKKK